MEGHIRMPERHPAILPKQSKKIWSDGKGPGENVLFEFSIFKVFNSNWFFSCLNITIKVK